jgi:dTDP-4-dehydrorhamnose 3,5-epimerase
MVYVPEGVAHGFITLTDSTELAYWISADYRAEHQLGFRWDDPQIGIGWPLRPVVLSGRDAALPSFRDRNRAARVP